MGFNDDSEAQDGAPWWWWTIIGPGDNGEDDASEAVTQSTAPQLELPPNPPSVFLAFLQKLKEENPFASYQQQQQQARAPFPQTAKGSSDPQTQQQGGVAAEKPLDRLRKAKELLDEGLIERKNTTR